jgi:hypothetical protein
MMRRIAITVAVAAAALPAIALASAAQSAAEKQCRQELTSMGKAVFKQTYGTNKDQSNAFGKCVSHRTAQNIAVQNSARRTAANQCQADQNDPNFAANHNGQTFDQVYGSGPKHKNAYSRCVSTKAKALTAQGERSEVTAEDNAAKQCRSEQANGPAAFKTKYGTNRTKSNAFSRCVSQTAHAIEQQSSS